jgi:hypothetical protein
MSLSFTSGFEGSHHYSVAAAAATPTTTTTTTAATTTTTTTVSGQDFCRTGIIFVSCSWIWLFHCMPITTWLLLFLLTQMHQ